MIELCRKGDRNAQKALFDLLAPRMYPVCIRYVGDREVALDLLQDFIGSPVSLQVESCYSPEQYDITFS